jgi:hypothetical protein
VKTCCTDGQIRRERESEALFARDEMHKHEPSCFLYSLLNTAMDQAHLKK